MNLPKHDLAPPIQVTRPSMPEFEAYVDMIRPLWESRWLSNNGEHVRALESELTDVLDVPHVSLLTNGHLALETAIDVLGLSGEVITTPFTFASTTHALVRKGITPVFCDINPIDYTIDVTKLEALITDKTTAILPVHVYGNVCHVEAIDRIAKRHGLKVLYDAAHAFGVVHEGRGIATYGDMNMFSFHATKVFHTIEGGALAYRDDSLKADIDLAVNFGITGPESVEAVGGNAKMNEFQAAMGRCNLPRLEDDIAKRRAIVERYDERLKDVPTLRLNRRVDETESNYAYYPVLFKGDRRRRDEMMAWLADNGIFARKYFYPLVTDFACYAFTAHVPNAKYVSDRVLTLPLYPDLTLEMVDRICDVIIEGGNRL
ncbi:DegT/DnrJ/EryC1/StrS family aminotransferase [Exiguobacterium alkaliphilum]|uniref:DegT/DnrJ/EryC1/StrS family aminotransferase n=1 Tax=Exiguobacterium alkaliphilum TaxID=1428684 RepID=A0ABT2KZW1_9BACL|nr:DegT/DnrJ/EryC1/StrS family aminotransferase [Exiguobacterium alkaliphilum]MCT4795958.1 DegT/DnrJ/EryC1/StrS family aminotransferase [Exiguobacterium alkaliphilum]